MSGDRLTLSSPQGTDPKGISALEHAAEDASAKAYQLADLKAHVKALEKGNADLEKLIAKAQQKPPANASKKTAPGKSSHVAHAQGWKAICTEPDLCKVGKDIIAFDSFATLDQHHKASPDVKARGTHVYRKGDMIKGVQADAGKHIESGTSQGSGHVKILDGHNNVKVNNIPIAKHDGNCLINCDASGNGGAKGKLVTEQKSVTASASTASNPQAPPGQRTSEKLARLTQAKAKLEAGQLDFNALDEYINFKDSNAGFDGFIGKIQGTPGSASDYAAQATRGVLGFVKDGVMGIGEMAYEGIKAVPKIGRSLYTSSGQAISQLDAQILAENIQLGNITPGTIGQGALDIGKAMVKPVTDPWKKGQYVESGTRAVTEVGTLAFGWIKGSKAAQAAKAADALKAEQAAEAAKVAAAAAEAAKAEELAAAAKADAAADGVHVARIAGRVSTEPNSAHFWSGRSVDSNGQKIGGAGRAAEIAKKNGGTTLETLIEERKIKMPDWDPNNQISIKAWEDISAEYATGVSGEVKAVIGNELRPGNIWQTKELPALLKNPNVTKIITIDPVSGVATIIFP